MTEAAFDDSLRQRADDIWQASFEHAFVREAAAGTLAEDAFRFYVQQDSYYLSQFAGVQSLAASRAPTAALTHAMASHAKRTHEVEQELHEMFAVDLGLSATLDDVTPAPTAYAYTSHLWRAGRRGCGDAVAALLPCYWLYWEIGQRYAEASPEHPIYERWLATYGDEAFGRRVRQARGWLNRLADGAGAAARRRMGRQFMLSSRYEYLFWEMAYRQETWPPA